MFGAFQPTKSSQSRLVVDGESLQHPARLVEVREQQWVPSKHRLSKSPDAARPIEMKDVGELVGDDERVPVRVVAESRGVGRRVRVNDDAIRRKRSRVTVDVIDVVGDDEIDRYARR